MKIRRSIILFVAFVAGLTLVAVWFAKRRPANTAIHFSTNTNAISSVVPASSPLANVLDHTNILAAQIATTTDKAVTAKLHKTNNIVGDLAALNNVTIEFYGRLEDQFGSPVVGARIATSIRIYNGVDLIPKAGQIIS